MHFRNNLFMTREIVTSRCPAQLSSPSSTWAAYRDCRGACLLLSRSTRKPLLPVYPALPAQSNACGEFLVLNPNRDRTSGTINQLFVGCNSLHVNCNNCSTLHGSLTCVASGSLSHAACLIATTFTQRFQNHGISLAQSIALVAG